MSGHSHWAGIKHKKEAADQKRGQVFSKLLTAISAAAKSEPNPDFNPRLRTAVEKAKEAAVPKEKIDEAIKRAYESAQGLEELIFEAFGPGGSAIIIEAISDNKSRAIQEVKKILGEHGAKWAESGNVRWAFSTEGGERSFKAKFPQEISTEDKIKLQTLIAALEGLDDVQHVYTNAKGGH